MSLRSRLAWFGAGVVALALVLFGVLLYALLSRGVNTNQDDALRTRARQAVSALGASPDLIPRSSLAPIDLRSSTEMFVEVFDPSWNLVYSTAELNGAPPGPSTRLKIGTPEVTGGYFDTDAGIRYFGLEFDRGFVVTGQSTTVPETSLSGVVTFFLISAVPALMAALAASWLVAGRALRPLRAAAGAAEEIGRTRDFARRVPEPKSRDEVALLATSFNRMLEQLQDSYELQRRFVADASHELRTPITTIRANAGLLTSDRTVSEAERNAAVEDIAEESGRMSRLVERMLTLAEADAGVRLAHTPVDLRELVQEVCRQAARVRGEIGISSVVVDATVAGDEDSLRQLVWILVDNALRYARSAVEVRLTVEDGWARLVVADDGPGIAAEDRERVFDRFYRSDRSRTGGHAGLGLSIARWIAEQHDGRTVAGQALLGGAALLVDVPLLRPSQVDAPR